MTHMFQVCSNFGGPEYLSYILVRMKFVEKLTHRPMQALEFISKKCDALQVSNLSPLSFFTGVPRSYENAPP